AVDLDGDGVVTVALTVPSGQRWQDGVDEVTRLVRYEVAAGDEKAIGWKSLFYVLPKLDLRARLPEQLAEGGAAKVRVFAIDPTTDRPRADIDVRLTVTDATGGQALLTARTDADGTAVFDVPAREAGEYRVNAEADDGTTTVAVLEQDLEVVRRARVLVTTDKPLYQPGQTMHIRALALRKPQLDAIGAAPAIIEVRDGKGNMVFRKRADTNAFGVVSTDFKLATEVNVGDYRVDATVADTTTAKTVTVKPYRLPKYKVTTTLDAPYYLAGETVHGTVDARYFFGKATAGATVSLTASAADIGFTDFATLSGTTDADGVWAFELPLPTYLVGQPLESGNALVSLTLDVADTAGQHELKQVAVVVAKERVHVVAIPESGRLAAGLDNGVFLFATDPLGQPLDVTFTATASAGVAAPGALEVTPLAPGIARVEVTPSAAVALSVTATAADGASAQAALELPLGASGDGVLLRTDRALYRAGDTVNVQVLATTTTGRAFVDVIQGGQTVLTQGVDLAGGAGSYALDLDATLVGDLLIEAYVVMPDASIVRDEKIVFVKDAGGLDIALATDKPQYAPGEEATLTFTVKDKDGQPAVAALGVQIVDEAVYALTEMRPGLLESYFLIQEALATPRYEVHGVSFDVSGLAAQAPEDPIAQTVAETAFAALDTEASGELSSWETARVAVKGVLGPFYEAHRKQMEEDFAALAAAGTLTYDNAESVVAAQTAYYDYWGHPYTFATTKDWDAVRTQVTSRGPDEIAGTSDDWSGAVVVVESPMRNEWGFDADGAATGGMPPEAQNPVSEGGGATEGVKVRKDFPETLYWNPALITDGAGEAQVTLSMADSITEWRVSTLGSTAGGVLGSMSQGITVFQDFFVDVDFPASLTRGDAVTFPVVVYNYLPTAQTVTVSVAPASWFTLSGPSSQSVRLEAGEVKSVGFPVTVTEVGTHGLLVTGVGTTLSDAVQREVRVTPDGVRQEAAAGGVLEGSQTFPVAYPEGTIAGSAATVVKIYPGVMAQAVEGLDSMLQMPSGCFEQTTATNWPNTLVLDYLRASGQVSPEIELKALDYLQQGYQRLLTFECTGGGFVWFGDPAPANVVLSAMGVLEFGDMAKVIEIDPAVLTRTAAWLVGAQRADGSWTTDQGSEFATVQYDDTKTTAFAAWSLASAGVESEAVAKAVTWLEPKAAAGETDVYSLALIANAFAAADPGASRTAAVLDRLADLAEVDEDGRVSWTYEGSSYNYWGGEGSGPNPTSIEVTALVVQAFLAGGQHTDLASGALAFLAGQKDALGNYGTTHATILTLRAMIASLQNKTEDGEGTVTVSVGGSPVATLAITEENRNVFHQIELGAVAGDVTVAYEGTGRLMTQVVSRWYEPAGPATLPSAGALGIEVAYDKSELAVNDTVTATATVENRTDAQLDMVMIDLGLPPGFTLLTDELEDAVASGLIMKYQVRGQQLSVYLDHVAARASLAVTYRLQAKYPIEAQAPQSETYLYYDGAVRTATAGARLVVR
ncbi:MAG: hypothetical protein KC635_18630, partial [Myxococcales bacterium]|nr:hypothetical protein [Myxococcales bacterium]